jgi:hypothetical protein
VKEQEDRIEGKRKTAPSTAPHLNGYTKIDAISEEMNWNPISQRKRNAAQELIMDGVKRKNRLTEELSSWKAQEAFEMIAAIHAGNATMNDIAW